MKKILALLLSLVLSLTSVGALADEGFTATLDFEWAPEELLALAAADLDEESAAAAQMILPVINQLDLQVVKENEQFQLSILAKNIPIASLTLGLQGNQIVIVSDLFPSYYLSVSMETLEALMAEVEASRFQIDEAAEDAMEEAIEEAAEKFIEALSSYVGETETGSFVVDGETFTSKVPVNITLEEMVLLGMNLIKTLAADPAFADLLTMADLDITGLDETIAQLQQEAAANPHPCDLVLYSRPGDESALTLAVSEGDQLIAVSMLMLDGEVYGYMVIGDSSNDSFDMMYEAAMSGMEEAAVIEWDLAEGEDDSFYLGFAFCAMGIYMSLEADGAEVENGYVQNTLFSFPTPDSPIFASAITLQEGGKITLPISTAGKTAITVEELMNDPAAAEEKLAALSMDVQAYGLATLITNLIAAMPDEASAIFSQIMLLEQGLPLTDTTETVEVVETAAPYTAPATDAPAQTNGGGFMNVIRSTQAPDVPAPTQAPSNPGFFGKPGE